MKKILLFIAFLPPVIFATGWTKQLEEADALLGETESYYTYIYQPEEKGAFVFRSDMPDQFFLFGLYMFDTFYDNGVTYCNVRVGLYNKENRLLDHFDMCLGVKNNEYTTIGTFNVGVMFQPVGQKKNTRKIFKHLHGSDGYVRFVANTYSHGRFELKVEPIDKNLDE